MENTNEIIDSQNDETTVDAEIITDDTIVSDDINALKEKLSSTEEKNRQLFIRAKKAEGFELRGDHWVKRETKSEPSVAKSGELDYGQKAFLRAEGIKGQEELSLVQAYMGNTGKSLEEIVENKWFQNELKDMREVKATQEATPTSSARSVTGIKDENYWLAKYSQGTSIAEVPQEFRARVLDAKVAQDERRDKFTDNPVIQ